MNEFMCSACAQICKTPSEFLRYQGLHKMQKNFVFKCGHNNWKQQFSRYTALIVHVRRLHKQKTKQVCFEKQYKCLKCCFILKNHEEYMAHLKKHLRQKEKITCPFEKCEKNFVQLSAFNTHMHRWHKFSVCKPTISKRQDNKNNEICDSADEVVLNSVVVNNNASQICQEPKAKYKFLVSDKFINFMVAKMRAMFEELSTNCEHKNGFWNTTSSTR